MPLKLVLGPANATKAGEVLAAYPAAARRGGLLVVPTAADALHYTRQLAGTGALIGTVLTFPALMRVIAARAGYAAEPLSALQRERVLADVLEQTTLAGRAGVTPGLVSAAASLIDELERALITPARFGAALDRWSAEDPRRRRRAAGLALLYREYVEQLERLGRSDEVLFAWRALDALRSSPGRWRGSPVYLYGFDDLLGIERDAVETLARVAGAEVVVSLTYEPGRTALQARAGVAQELRAIAREVIELPARADHYHEGSRAALHHLERRLFETPGERVPAGGAITLLEAGGERAEAELIADQVLRMRRDGVPAEQIAIICRAPARSAPLLRAVLERHGIALAADLQRPLVDSALLGALAALARCADPGASAGASELVRFLRVRAGARGEPPEELDALELRARRRGLRSAAALEAALGRRVEELERLRGAGRPGEVLVAIGRRLLRDALAAADAGGVAALQPDARALSRLDAALGELCALDQAPAPRTLASLIGSLTVRAHDPPRPGAVALCDPLQVRARRFEALILCGLVEGEWPAAPRSDPLLSDEQRFELAQCSGLRLEPREERLAAERYLFYSVLTRAAGRLVLSWRSSDEEGNALAPSPFLEDVVALFDGGLWERRARRLLADVVWPADAAPDAPQLARACAAQAGRCAGAPPQAPICLSAAALSCVRHRQIVSGGALEAFAACPMRWLIERQLAPRALEPDPEPMRRGSYMHWVLERVFAQLARPLCQRTLEHALAILDGVLEAPWSGEGAPAPGEPPIGVGRSERVRAAMRLGIAADLRRYLRCEARSGPGWPPAALELRFGFDDQLPPLALRGKDGQQVALRGVIDRIDVDGGGRRAIVRDYKSGSARPEHQGARWRRDGSLQVGLYMLAAARLLGLEPVAGLYQPLAGRDLRPRGVYRADLERTEGLVCGDAREAGELRALLEDIEAQAVAIWEQLCSGVLERSPQSCSREGCRHPGICRGG